MEKEKLRATYCTFQYDKPIQDVITYFIDIKKKAKKEGWTELIVSPYMITGMRLETDEEYNIRIGAMKALETISTVELLAIYKGRSRSPYSSDEQRYIIKRVLDARDNLPSGKFENKAVRILKKKYCVKKTSDLYKDYSVEISKLTKELEEKK